MQNFTVKKGKPFPLGLTKVSNGINLAVAMKNAIEPALLLYNSKDGKREFSISLTEDYRFGNIYSVLLEGIEENQYEYNFYDGRKRFQDPYARTLHGCKKWGDHRPKCVMCNDKEYDWENDHTLLIPYRDTVIYLIHVRGFTKHRSSMVKNPGTFEGIIEKIPYLKELGINQIELMPAYEFDEIIRQEKRGTSISKLPDDSKELLALQKKMNEIEGKKRINYWGYSEAFYFAPKVAYAAKDDASVSFKDMVKALHQSGIEVVMQFYFKAGTQSYLISDCIKSWVMNYHIDGVHLLGPDIPIKLLATDPLLAGTKLAYERIPEEEIFEGNEKPSYQNLAVYQDDFMYACRKYLKSDDDMLKQFSYHQRVNPSRYSTVHYMTNYYGFTLNDLVSYDRKHNEENGENNRDGNDYNYSWNCGVEGKSRKKAVIELRKKQIRNALTFVMLSQGVPMLVAGDEFCHSQNGNNNAYCQDNVSTWINWENQKKHADIFAFTKSLIAFRMAHPVFHQENEPRLLDYLSCGYPDLSYHGTMAWYPRFENYNRHLGCMYCGSYVKTSHKKEDDFFYIAFNMYWVSEKFALPKLPKGKKWYLVFSTKEGFIQEGKPLLNQDEIMVADRCSITLTGK